MVFNIISYVVTFILGFFAGVLVCRNNAVRTKADADALVAYAEKAAAGAKAELAKLKG